MSLLSWHGEVTCVIGLPSSQVNLHSLGERQFSPGQTRCRLDGKRGPALFSVRKKTKLGWFRGEQLPLSHLPKEGSQRMVRTGCQPSVACKIRVWQLGKGSFH